MNVYQKLALAREKFHAAEIRKSGQNKFAGYSYFELGDFVPPAIRIFAEVGLTSVTTFNSDFAVMEIINAENPEERIAIRSPLAEANLKGCHPIQNLGAVQTYVRRYLWVTALEIVEHDAVDSAEPQEKVEKQQKVVAKRYVEADPKHELFVDAMLEWSSKCETVSSLTDLWKSNQDSVDELKTGAPDQYKRLTSHFAACKQALKEESGDE